LVLDASKGSLCEVVISACVKNIIVKGNKDSFVSVVFQPTFNNTSGAQGTSLIVNGDLTGKCEVTTNWQRAVVVNDYEIGSIKVGKIHTFSILGIQRGVTFGTVMNQAKYFTLNQTRDIMDYGLTQGGIARANWNSKQLQLLTSDTFIVSTFINYGHFLVTTTNLGSVSYSGHCKSVKPSNPGNCKDAYGDSYCDKSLNDDRTFWLANVLVKCKLTSTGRNKNFRIPLGIFYVWAGAEIRLCNVSCECIRGPEPCKCFNAVCYEPDATKAPLINCVAVICGISEIQPDSVPCSPNVSSAQSSIWNRCGGDSSKCDIGCYSGSSHSDNSSDDSSSCDSSAVVLFGKNFDALSVNPCFIKKANLIIKNSDLVICEIVKRVWTCPLGCQCIDNASSDPHCPQPFVSTCYDQTYVKTVRAGDCGNLKAINSSRIYSYLLGLQVSTPAFYLGGNLEGDSEFDLSNIRVDRFVQSQQTAPGDNGWPQGDKHNDYCYAVMFSKCKDDPVIDPKTTLPRRCCDLNCEFTIPDRVRPYCHTSFAPTQLSPACKSIISTSDVLNTVCKPVCAELCEILPSTKANGKNASTNVILNKQCCKIPVPSKQVCLVKPPKHHEPKCEVLKNKLCEDWDECSIASSKQSCDWQCNNGSGPEWDDTAESSNHH
jgi:hypothetical protein